MVSCDLNPRRCRADPGCDGGCGIRVPAVGQINRSIIVVDTFTQWLPERVRNVTDAFWDIAYAAAALVLSWRLSVATFDAIRSHTVSTVIGLPIGWLMLVGAVMLLLLALTAVLTAGRLLRGSNDLVRCRSRRLRRDVPDAYHGANAGRARPVDFTGRRVGALVRSSRSFKSASTDSHSSLVNSAWTM
jgi:hypothetical protein